MACLYSKVVALAGSTPTTDDALEAPPAGGGSFGAAHALKVKVQRVPTWMVIAACVFSGFLITVVSIVACLRLLVQLDERAVAGIQPGVARATYEARLRRPIVRSIDVPPYTCVYYALSTPAMRFIPNEHILPDAVESLQELPHLYGCVQVLLNAEGRVEAVAWNEMRGTVLTASGELRGNHVAVIEEHRKDETP
jgi:hypothetical protein